MQGGYGRKYRIKPRFFIIIVAIAGVAVWGLVSALGLFRPARVEWGRLSSNQSITAIVLRDEQLVLAPEYSKLACVAAEGGQVKKDTQVAELYLSGYSDKDISTLVKLENDIKDYQENNILKDIKDAGLESLNTQINNTMNQISAMALDRQTQGLAAAEQDLRTYMQQRKDYMPTFIKADDTLNRMYDNENTLLAKINQTRKPVNSPADGLVSYYLDGLEKTLTVTAIDKMTPGTMKALMNSIFKNSSTFASNEYVQAKQPICRIVNASKWYAVVVMDESQDPFVQGVSYDVTFDGLPDTASAKAVKVTSEGGTTLAVLQLATGVKEMLSLRLVTGHLGRDIEGFRVPLSMIAQSNGKFYIAIQGEGPKVNRMEVTMLGKDSKYAIIKETANTGELEAGLQLVRP